MADPMATQLRAIHDEWDKWEERNPYGPCRLIYRPSQAGNGPTPTPLDSDYAGLEKDKDFLDALEGGSLVVRDECL